MEPKINILGHLGAAETTCEHYVKSLHKVDVMLYENSYLSTHSESYKRNSVASSVIWSPVSVHLTNSHFSIYYLTPLFLFSPNEENLWLFSY